MLDTDVLIVGAGPAGATAARELAARGVETLLVDRETFPRRKVCAGWVSGAVTDAFEWLAGSESSWSENAFDEIVFHRADLVRDTSWKSDGVAGHLVRREVFDAFLKDAAVAAGARFQATAFEDINDGVVSFADGRSVNAGVVVAADGAMGRLAVQAGLRPKWTTGQLVTCMNRDVACDGGCPPRLHVVPAYANMAGYAWVFHKGTSASVGIGGAAAQLSMPAQIFERFFAAARQKGLIAADAESGEAEMGVAPAGGILGDVALVKGNVLAVGDAGGFVSAATGEGIFPGMLSGKLAADVIAGALSRGDLGELGQYEKRARDEIGPQLASDSATLAALLPMVFDNRNVAERCARYFLFGERLL